MELTTVTEGATELRVPAGSEATGRGPSSAGAGFYNPAMTLTRDVSVLLARADHPREHPRYLDGLAATGARGLRVANEAAGWQVTLNDRSPKTAEIARSNAEHVGLDVEVETSDLNALFTRGSWDHIDIDPYGSPTPFIDLAVRAVRDGGLLSVGATDTAALHGAKPAPARRRYLAEPPRAKVPGWKAAAARLLVGAIVRSAARFDRAARPVLVYPHQHCFRAVLRIEQGARAADEAIDEVRTCVLCPSCYTWGWDGCDCARGDPSGPYWAGRLHDPGLLSAMRDRIDGPPLACRKAVGRLLASLEQEAKLGPFYLDIDDACRAVRAREPPARADLIAALEEQGLPAAHLGHYTANAVGYVGAPEDALDVLRGLAT